jgi:predicted DCC family thiol-disulfide oxidoreductase YuxK
MAAYLVTEKGQIHRGSYAFRMLTLRLLPLIPWSPIFWMPGVSLAGVRVYHWVARNRYRLSGCDIT